MIELVNHHLATISTFKSLKNIFPEDTFLITKRKTGILYPILQFFCKSEIMSKIKGQWKLLILWKFQFPLELNTIRQKSSFSELQVHHSPTNDKRWQASPGLAVVPSHEPVKPRSSASTGCPTWMPTCGATLWESILKLLCSVFALINLPENSLWLT